MIEKDLLSIFQDLIVISLIITYISRLNDNDKISITYISRLNRNELDYDLYDLKD